MITDDLFGEDKIGLQQRRIPASHRGDREAAHLGHLVGQCRQLIAVRGPHSAIVGTVVGRISLRGMNAR